MSFVRVKQSFATADRVYVVGTVLSADDPVVAPRPELFDRVEDIAPVVEQATAAPGEKRTRTRTRKATADIVAPDEV